MNHLAGKFIVFDGTEGCGKSTQAKLFFQTLESARTPALLVRDPGTTRIGEQIRAILLNPDHEEMGMRCEMLLYMAARAQMMVETILPALAKRQCVLADRFVSSTLAYQLGGDGLSADQIRAIGDIAIQGRWPDHTILFDLPVEKSIARVRRAKDRIEQRPMDYHARVRENYLAQARSYPDRYSVIDGDRPVEAIHADVLRVMEKLK